MVTMRRLSVCAFVPLCLGILSLFAAHRLTEPSTAQARALQEMQSTMTGVYTTAQAARGEETYMAVCVSCHPAGTYKAAGFRAAWIGRPLSELYDQIKEKMPKNDPASLTPGECAQVLAYLLKINGVPAGETELSSEAETLKKIRIEMPAQGGRH
jgi:cytochrome c5